MDYTVTKGDTLSGIAQKNNTTVDALAKGNNISNPNLIKIGQSIKIPSVITAAPSQTSTTATFNQVANGGPNTQGSLTPPTPAPVNTSYAFNYATMAKDALNQADPNVTRLEGERSTMLDDLKREMGLLGNKQTDTLALNEQQGVNASKKTVLDLSNQILANKTQAQVGKLDKNKFGGLTTGDAVNVDNEIDRNAAIRNLTLTSQMQAAQGNLALAEDTVKQAIEAKYEPMQNKIDTLKQYLDLNKEELTRADKKAYEAQQTLLSAKMKDLETQKDNDLKIQEMVTKAAGQTAPADLLGKASKAKTVSEAAIILGAYAGDYWQMQSIQQAIEKSKADIAQTNAETTAKYSNGTGVVAGYDISKYATDPNHEKSVAKLYSNLGSYDFSNPLEIDKAIKTASSTSPITGQMVLSAASQYGVDPKMVFAMMQQDSSLGTKGTGARNNNPGNIGQFDHLTGAVKGYPTLQEGVNAVAQWLSKNKTQNNYGLDASKFTAGNKTAYQNVQGVIESAKNWANKINSNNGTVAGVGLGGLIPSKFISQNGQDSRTALNALNLRVQQWASGASLTESQTNMVKNFMPSEYDSDTQVKQKLNSLVDFMNTQMKTIAQSEGQQYNPPSVSLFENKELETILNAIESSTNNFSAVPVDAYTSQFKR